MFVLLGFLLHLEKFQAHCKKKNKNPEEQNKTPEYSTSSLIIVNNLPHQSPLNLSFFLLVSQSIHPSIFVSLFLHVYSLIYLYEYNFFVEYLKSIGITMLPS